jgi:hypothetical protein
MSSSALITMVCTWALILYCAIVFFVRVCRAPKKH